MAVLGATSLTGCNSIPSFIASGSKMIFQNATAPVSWTKDTTPNQSVLRLINGSTLSPGGSLTFSQVFTTRSFNVSTTATTANVSISPGFSAPTTITVSASSSNLGPFPTTTSSSSTLDSRHMVQHTHPYTAWGPAFVFPGTNNQAPNNPKSGNFNPAGSSQSHNHSVPTTTPHSHSVSLPSTTSHSHPFSQSQHSHSVPGSIDFSVNYVDMIIASKN